MHRCSSRHPVIAHRLASMPMGDEQDHAPIHTCRHFHCALHCFSSSLHPIRRCTSQYALLYQCSSSGHCSQTATACASTRVYPDCSISTRKIPSRAQILLALVCCSLEFPSWMDATSSSASSPLPLPSPSPSHTPRQPQR